MMNQLERNLRRILIILKECFPCFLRERTDSALCDYLRFDYQFLIMEQFRCLSRRWLPLLILISYKQRSILHHNSAAWGSYFFDNGHRTYWKHLLRHSATLCIPCLSSLCDYEITHRYESHEEHMLHPCALLQREIPSYTIYYKQNEKVWLFHGLASSFF